MKRTIIYLALVVVSGLYSGIIDAQGAGVSIGDQVWATTNLSVTTFRNGDPVPEAESADDWQAAGDAGKPAWCYYIKKTENGDKYGKLYNWYAVNDPRGLAPQGWHIPSDSEWMVLINYFGGDKKAGKKLKSTAGWKYDGNGDNGSGFSGLPGGYRLNDNSFGFLGEYGYFWTSSMSSGNGAWNHGLLCYGPTIAHGDFIRECGFSVRCIKDSGIPKK